MSADESRTMSGKLGTARAVGRSMSKLFAGVPGERRRLLAGALNVGRALRFLVARKLVGKPDVTIRLGHAGQLHDWQLIERSDLSVLEEIFLDREYELGLAPPAVVVDLGANFGAATVYFAQAWPSARIFAVEPNPAVFERLKRNAVSYRNVTCLNYAVSDRNGTAQFVVSTDHIGSSLRRPDPHGRSIEVQTRSLAGLLAEIGVGEVDLLKFDVEGAEEELFRDRSVLSRIKALVGEVHLDLMKMSETEFLGQFDDFEVTRRSSNGDLFVMSAQRRSR